MIEQDKLASERERKFVHFDAGERIFHEQDISALGSGFELLLEARA